MSMEWTQGTCNETTGFLFRHQCTEYPQSQCAQCSRPLCELHIKPVEGQILCVACRRLEEKAQGVKAGRARGYDDDPYFYGGSYYSGYGGRRFGHSHYYYMHDVGRSTSDPHDFNAGDAESLKQEGDGDFEADMGES